MRLFSSSSFDLSAFESAICAAALSSLEADQRKETLVEWWNAGDVHGAAEAYVTDYAARMGFAAHILNTEESRENFEGFEAIDVSFYKIENGQLNDEREQCFTVWLWPAENGRAAFVYGEW